ncbi:low affinity immunoglobulin epsilon Fc receptor-like [Candoia aspera]|uniref:low affinity immunoglobulin epsilon Fc receptor-like n=1 Tax=Candoia aspera TaxID=51853 RepID=UPI002FD7AA41
MASQGIYKRCEEPEKYEKKPSMILERAGSFLPQCCRCGSEGISIPPIYLVNIASFLLWIITVAVMISKYSEMSKKLEDLRLNQTLLRINGLNTEKQLQEFHSNHSAYESVLNNNLQNLKAYHNSTKKDVINRMDQMEIKSGKNLEEIFKLMDAIHKINASGCQLCPEGWLLNRGQCYYFEMMSKHWSFAKKSCEDHGGSMVVINDRDEQRFLQLHLKGKEFWIGLNDMKTESKFIWIDNTPLTYIHWYPREPNNGGKGEDCVVMTASGFWQDRECGGNADGWICEKPWNC